MAIGGISGIYDVQIAFRSSAGYPMGTQTSPDAVSNGTTTHAYRVRHVVSWAPPDISRVTATFKGGQKNLGQNDLGPGDFGTGTLTLAALDETFDAYVRGGSVDTSTASGLSITALNSQEESLPQFVMAVTTRFTNLSGAQEYATIIYNNVQIAAPDLSSSQDGGVNPNPLAYIVTPSVSSNTGWGFTFANTALNVQDDTDIATRIRYTKRMALTTYVDDGSSTSFILGYLPTSTTVDGSINVFSVDGADGNSQATALSASTAVLTWTAGSAGEVVVVMYATDFDAVPA